MTDIHWRDRASCRDDPGGFDLDHLTAVGIAYALSTCLRCPVLAACTEWTDTLTGIRTPQGVVQAGRVWPARGGKRAALKDLEEMQ